MSVCLSKGHECPLSTRDASLPAACLGGQSRSHPGARQGTGGIQGRLSEPAGQRHTRAARAGSGQLRQRSPVPKAWCFLPEPFHSRNQTGFGMAETGSQHLPAPAPHAAALPSVGALAAGGPCRGATHRSHSSRRRPSDTAAGAYSSYPERPPGAASRGRWGRSAARGSLGRVVPWGRRRRRGAEARTTSPRAARGARTARGAVAAAAGGGSWQRGPAALAAPGGGRAETRPQPPGIQEGDGRGQGERDAPRPVRQRRAAAALD